MLNRKEVLRFCVVTSGETIHTYEVASAPAIGRQTCVHFRTSDQLPSLGT